MKYVFLSNAYDPNKPFAETQHCYSYEAFLDANLCHFEWQQHLKWINSFVVSRPKSTPHYTVEQLESMNMIGVYCPFDKYDWRTPDEEDIVEF